MAFAVRKRNLTRVFWAAAAAVLIRVVFFSGSSNESKEIRGNGVMDYVKRADKALDVQRYDFLQVRMGRDERDDIFGETIREGIEDYWERFEKPYILNPETSHVDQQHVQTALEQLLSLNGWVAALCPTLTRPFGGNRESAHEDLVRSNHLYFIAIVIHSADHFLVDQLAVIVQMAKRLGSHNLFVSMLDYESTDSTETVTDLCEAVLTLLGVPFRIRRVPAMTVDEDAAYYPLEEAHTRNLALEPLHELYAKRKIKFHRVVWLKGFTCPNDIFETIKVSQANDAAMVCGMDWAEHNGFFIFSDRWRTRDILGDQFRLSRSSSAPEAGPPRERIAAERYAQHLPFQAFCCESGTHVVDPAQSYYQGIRYRHGDQFHNLSTTEPMTPRTHDAPCLDSSQAHFCRDLWVNAAKEGVAQENMKDEEEDSNLPRWMRWKRSTPKPEPAIDLTTESRLVENERILQRRQAPKEDSDKNVGSDFDAMPDSDDSESDEYIPNLSIPNSVFRPARILINPRCVTTYAGVSHTQLALDLFGAEKDDAQIGKDGKYVLDDWEGAPESFVCQEQRQTGGRKAMKTQRRLGFSVHDELNQS